MSTPEEISNKITDYKTRAGSLEETRKGLVEEIKKAVISDIIPEITPLLPEHYSIDAEDSEVNRDDEKTDPVPNGFEVSLRLFYKGHSIYPHVGEDARFNKLSNIQNNLEPKLKELASKYNLTNIYVEGEPAVVIG